MCLTILNDQRQQLEAYFGTLVNVYSTTWSRRSHALGYHYISGWPYGGSSNSKSIKVEQGQNKVKYIHEYIFFNTYWQYAFNQ